MEQLKTHIDNQEEKLDIPLIQTGYKKQIDSDKSVTEENSYKKINYVFIEAFFCMIILLGILIIQNVKNTEDLQLAVRQQLRYNLTSEDIHELVDGVTEIAQQYQNGRP